VRKGDIKRYEEMDRERDSLEEERERGQQRERLTDRREVK
jgi:hypothetical protein